MRNALPGWEDRLKTFCEDRQGIFGIFTRRPDEWAGKPFGSRCARCGESIVQTGFDAYVPACTECFDEVAIKETKFTLAGAQKAFDGVDENGNRKEPSISPSRDTLRAFATRVLYGLAAIGAGALASRVANGFRKRKNNGPKPKKNKTEKTKAAKPKERGK